jgi:hypothetical protein
MKKVQFASLLAVLVAVVFLSSGAQAQQVSNQLYASPTGTTAPGPCPASAPCSLLNAVELTQPGGGGQLH